MSGAVVTKTVQVFLSREQRDLLAALCDRADLQSTTLDTQAAARDIVAQYDRAEEWATVMGASITTVRSSLAGRPRIARNGLGFAGLPEHLQTQARTPE